MQVTALGLSRPFSRINFNVIIDLSVFLATIIAFYSGGMLPSTVFNDTCLTGVIKFYSILLLYFILNNVALFNLYYTLIYLSTTKTLLFCLRFFYTTF